jgi:hypothetical protein
MVRTPLIQLTIRAPIEADSSAATCKLPSTRTYARGPLLNHLVGAGEQCARNRKAKLLGGLQIDDEFEFGRLVDRDVTRFGPVEDLVHIVGHAPPELARVGLIGHPPAST